MLGSCQIISRYQNGLCFDWSLQCQYDYTNKLLTYSYMHMLIGIMFNEMILRIMCVNGRKVIKLANIY